MSDSVNPELTPDTNPEEVMVYEIRVTGHLDRRWGEWFGEVTITLEEDGVTLLTFHDVDQAALHGLLRQVRDLGMPLLSVTRVEPGDRS